MSAPLTKKAYRCLIVDDEPLAIQLIESHVAQLSTLTTAATAQTAIDALQLLKEQEFDLIFLDIQMPVLTGIELLRTMKHPPAVIFTTAYREYAVESYEFDAIDYLVKPITFGRFVKSVDKFLATMEQQPAATISVATTSATPQASSIFVNVNKKYVKVIYDDILYIESVKDYIHIHTASDTIITKEKISEFELKLPVTFLRVHRSFIVNSTKLTAFTAQDVEIGDKEIPIGKSYKNEVMGRLR